MHRNRVQVELAEIYEVPRSTISRAITAVTPLVDTVLEPYVPAADELDDRTQDVVDGTLRAMLVMCLAPGAVLRQHKTTGMTVQLACTLSGRLVRISDPVNGSRHDTYCLSESGVLHTLDPSNSSALPQRAE